MRWLVAALLACSFPAAALSPAAELALRSAAPGGEKADETLSASRSAADRLVTGGLAEREAVKLVIGALQAGRRPKELDGLSASVVAAVAGGLKPAVAAGISRAALGHGVDAPALTKLLTVSREAIAAGATARETQHVTESALRRGGVEGATSALESFQTLVAEGVDERDARKAVLRVVAEKAGSRAVTQQAQADVARSLEEKRLERERAKEEEKRQRDEEKREERRAAAGGSSASGGGSGGNSGPGGGGSSGSGDGCEGGDDDPSDPDCD